MRLKGALPCSKEPNAEPYPQPDESTPHPHTSYSLISSLVISPSTTKPPSGILPSGFPTNMHASFPCVLHGQPISISLT